MTLAYWTIVGRVDQFVLGVVAFSLRGYMEKRHLRRCLFRSFFSVLLVLRLARRLLHFQGFVASPFCNCHADH